MTDGIILYDIPSKGDEPTCWSLNPWKARLALNFKRLPYKTHWLEYPSIAPTLQSLSIPPNPSTTNPLATYSCPALHLPSGEYVMDSLTIAHALENLQPQPSLHLNHPKTAQTQEIVNIIWKSISQIVIPRVPEMLLNPPSAEFFERTREKRFGKLLSQMVREVDVEGVWREAEVGLGRLRELLGEEDGEFLLGKEASFADFIVVGMWCILKRVEIEGDLFGRGMGWDESGVFRRQWEGCRGWLEKDN